MTVDGDHNASISLRQDADIFNVDSYLSNSSHTPYAEPLNNTGGTYYLYYNSNTPVTVQHTADVISNVEIESNRVKFTLAPNTNETERSIAVRLTSSTGHITRTFTQAGVNPATVVTVHYSIPNGYYDEDGSTGSIEVDSGDTVDMEFNANPGYKIVESGISVAKKISGVNYPIDFEWIDGHLVFNAPTDSDYVGVEIIPIVDETFTLSDTIIKQVLIPYEVRLPLVPDRATYKFAYSVTSGIESVVATDPSMITNISYDDNYIIFTVSENTEIGVGERSCEIIATSNLGTQRTKTIRQLMTPPIEFDAIITDIDGHIITNNQIPAIGGDFRIVSESGLA